MESYYENQKHLQYEQHVEQEPVLLFDITNTCRHKTSDYLLKILFLLKIIK